MHAGALGVRGWVLVQSGQGGQDRDHLFRRGSGLGGRLPLSHELRGHFEVPDIVLLQEQHVRHFDAH